MSELSSILSQFLEQLASEMKAKLPKATGKTAEQIEVNVVETGDGLLTKIHGELTGPSYIYNLEYGRGPTKNTTASSPTLQQAILAWIQSKGFNFPLAPKYSWSKKIKDAQALSWAIAIKIHKEGMKAPAPGIITDVITDSRVESFTEIFSSRASRILLSQIITELK